MKIEINVSDLAKLQRDLDKLPEVSEAALGMIAADLQSGYKLAAFTHDAIDAGDFINGIDGRRISAREFVIGSDVDYEIYINEGVESRPSYPARHLDEKTMTAFENSDQAEQRISDALFRFINE